MYMLDVMIMFNGEGDNDGDNNQSSSEVAVKKVNMKSRCTSESRYYYSGMKSPTMRHYEHVRIQRLRSGRSLEVSEGESYDDVGE